MHQSVFFVPTLLVMIAPNKMKIAILSIVVCSILAVDAVPDNVYGSNQVQFSHPQPINYHYPQPQPHYGSQPNYHGAGGFHPAPQPQQHHGSNQFSEQYLVTAIKTDPAPPVVQYQQPSFKPESPFNGQSYIIEPSYLLKPFRPETSYHAQPYRPHNPAPYPPTYQSPSYPSYQVPSYPAPVYNQAPAYQPYPAPVYQSQVQGQSSVFLVYSTPLLAGYSTSTVTFIEPTKTVESSAVSASQVQSVGETVVPGPAVKWSDILSADANELGQKYADKGKADKEAAKESEEDDDEEKPATTKEGDSSSQSKKKQQDNEGSQEQSSSENANSQISYPIPANLASKAVWKIPKTVADYVQSAGTGPDGSVDSVQEVGDKKSPARDTENEESSSKSSLTDYNQVGTENKESSETTSTADQVTQVSLQGEPAKNEGRTHQAEEVTSSETPENNKESGIVELVTALQQEKPKSGSSVYYEQGPTIAGQEVVESKPQEESNLESSTLYKEPVVEISQPNSVAVDSEEEEEAGTEKSPVVYHQVDELQTVNYEAASYQPPKSESPYAVIAENPEVAIQVSPEEVSQLIYQLASLPGKPSDESEETTDAAVEVSSERTDQYAYQSPEPVASLPDESQEIADAVATPSTERPAYQTTYKPVIPRIYRPKVDSGEIEPPESDFGEKIKAFTKFALAVQKATHQGIYQQQSEPVRTAEPISFTPPAPYTSEEVTQDHKSESVSTQEKTSSENYAPNGNDEPLQIQPVSEPTYPAEGPIYEASLFYRKPVAPENEAGSTPPTAIQSEPEFSTEGPYKFKPLFYAQTVDKFTAPPPTTETKYEEPKLVQNVETTGSYSGRIVAEKMSPDEPVQVINAFHQFVYTGPSVPADSTSAPIVQLPVLSSDPMEKTENYATQRVYTASAETPGDYVPSSTPTYTEQNLYVTSTYAYIEEAGLSAEYQKEIASAQKEAEYAAQTSAEGPYDQTETSNISQEEATEIPAVSQSPLYETVKVISTEETSAEVSHVTDSYQEITKSPSYETLGTTKAKSAEVASAEVIYAPVTDSPPYHQEKVNAFSYEAAAVSTPKIKSAEEVSAEIVDAPATESTYQEKTISKAPAYDVIPPATSGPAYDVIPHAAASAEDVSNEDHAPPVTDQYEATEYPDVSLTNYQAPVITPEFIPAVAPPREIYPSTPAAEPESSTFGGSSSESQETTSNQPETKSNDPSAQITDSSYGTLPAEIPLAPCHHSAKSDGGDHFHKFLFNPAALANVPLDSVETSGEDESTTVFPDVTTPVTTSNESTSAETSTVATDGYKYVFKSRPTPNRFYESRSTTAVPSTNSTTVAPPTSKRPFVVIGKPIEMRKPVNGRVYSRPSPIPQRKPQTLAQIKILPTRLRSSSSTIQLPNRRFFIGRTLMNDKSNNQESKEDEAKKDA